MQGELTLLELNRIEEMIQVLSVLQELYPSLTKLQYQKELEFMLKHNYNQVAVYNQEICVGVSGFWIGNKLWCGKYLELDNIVVSNYYRGKGVGKLMFNYLEKKAREENCTMLSLDSYTTNYKAHKMFYNEGFAPKGFHFIKVLDKSKIR